jgi:hypothetical protein
MRPKKGDKMAHFIEIFIDLNVKKPMTEKGIAITTEAMLKYALEQHAKVGDADPDKVNWYAAIQVLKNDLNQ